MGFQVLIQGYVDNKLAESGTDATTIKLTNHNLQTGDMIVNRTLRFTNNNDPCSRIITRVDANTFTIPLAITDQAEGNQIRLFKFIDKTEFIKQGSLEVSDRMDRRNDCRFKMIVEEDAQLPNCGQNVKVLYDNQLIFGGAIKQINKRRISGGNSLKLTADVIVEGYNHIPSRRTIMANWSSPIYSKDIIKSIIDNYLVEEGITYTYSEFGNGYLWDEYPADVPSNAISIAQILKDMVDASGYKCYIDNNRKLHFKQEDTVVNAPFGLVTGEAYMYAYRVREIELEENQINYRNKVFFRGGADDFGDKIVTWGENLQAIKDCQDVEGGSGVYGCIVEDSEVDNTVEKTAGSTTTTTNINITNHGLSNGDMIVNTSRNNAKRLVTVVDNNNFTVSAITDQAPGDTIVYYPDANKLVRNNIKRYGLVTPKEISFETQSMDFRAGQKLKVQLTEFGMTAPEYFLVEEVRFVHVSGDVAKSIIKATSRAESDFSTQYSENAYDAYASFVGGGGGGGTVINKAGVNVAVSPTPPTSPQQNDLWLNTTVGVIDKTASGTLTALEADSIVQLFNAITITLPTPTSDLKYRTFTFKSRDTNTKTIVGPIDNVASYTLAGNNKALNVYCDGLGWYIWGVVT
ncbi:MAG TPA: hypothetical protein VIO64_10650 [Pseudobacteroides sp.]|uniref:hypothetical protein n=1 Tax=Pseudobacteroides sp. TaxID=1968840 RepID=UPI002F93C02E